MNLNALKDTAYRPAAADSFVGRWQAVAWQPNLFTPQTYVVGVLVSSDAGEHAFRLMDEPERLDCFFAPRPIKTDFAWIMAVAREALAKGEQAFPTPNLQLTPPQFVRGTNADTLAIDLFDKLVIAAQPRNPGQPVFVAQDTSTIRDQVNQALRRIASLDFERIVRSDGEIIRDRGDHFFDVNLILDRGVGTVVSAWYKSLLSVKINIFQAAQDVQAYAASRHKDARAVFIARPESPAGLTAKERRDIEAFIAEETWKMECQGIRAVTLEDPELIAREVHEWAKPLLA